MATPPPSSSDSNPSFSMSAYMMPSQQDSFASDSDLEDDVASLPSVSTSDSDMETLSDDYSDAEAEWRESIEQLELMLTMVLVPFVGKYLGRRCAYWSWTRFMQWKYPVEVTITNPGLFKGAGVIEAAATL
ncbi:Uncharacterized protein PECH_000046 [Penicillium ucsense]|uniref:Uncharacterized protein n=2 Tax=Penicillium TaxID=5073 RepID=A0A8J8VYG4_9EURO|nr:uncharacterized protein N7539_007801 [Penicillium diatomitis]KAF7714236.1 Uncharacterized protein PECM_008670 [Penicillium ucsense]KAF7739533.1 Uncharacterized protein PECH_000046 [Penicillium ucsense]KAJ5475514.1 hypothetical protein N7539_007801 [Penicillium diatomitis]